VVYIAFCNKSARGRVGWEREAKGMGVEWRERSKRVKGWGIKLKREWIWNKKWKGWGGTPLKGYLDDDLPMAGAVAL